MLTLQGGVVFEFVTSANTGRGGLKIGEKSERNLRMAPYVMGAPPRVSNKQSNKQTKYHI